ncbi:hypothetical protein [Candidatus Nitrosacidococcus sp. I8]|nr:hypothetical protein [Candidatus Nitrosacidococcus sp. I8]CAH9018049.1 hypothetical protein NURINAE_00697 [Candidatus Nitrosacidococcus sp. I8]
MDNIFLFFEKIAYFSEFVFHSPLEALAFAPVLIIASLWAD